MRRLNKTAESNPSAAAATPVVATSAPTTVHVELDRIEHALATTHAPGEAGALTEAVARLERMAKAAGLWHESTRAGLLRLSAQWEVGRLWKDVDSSLEFQSGMDETAAPNISATQLWRMKTLASFPKEQTLAIGEKAIAAGEDVPHVQAVIDKLRGRSGMGPDYNSAGKSVEHYTPPNIVLMVQRVFGGTIDLDPCSNLGEPNVPAKHHYTRDDDGLSKRWKGSVFCNPPYGKEAAAWAAHARAEVDAGRARSVIVLLAARPGTEAFKLLRGCPVCFFDERIQFIGERNTGKAPFPSAAYWVSREPSDRFAEVFREAGSVYVLHPLCEATP